MNTPLYPDAEHGNISPDNVYLTTLDEADLYAGIPGNGTPYVWVVTTTGTGAVSAHYTSIEVRGLPAVIQFAKSYLQLHA